MTRCSGSTSTTSMVRVTSKFLHQNIDDGGGLETVDVGKILVNKCFDFNEPFLFMTRSSQATLKLENFLVRADKQ